MIRRANLATTATFCSSSSALQMAFLALERGGSKKLNCFTLALLLPRSRGRVVRDLAATEKSVNDRPGTEQLAGGGEHGCLRGSSVRLVTSRPVQICPPRGHQSAAAIG